MLNTENGRIEELLLLHYAGLTLTSGRRSISSFISMKGKTRRGDEIPTIRVKNIMKLDKDINKSNTFELPPNDTVRLLIFCSILSRCPPRPTDQNPPGDRAKSRPKMCNCRLQI
ncbi:hypothetical protein AAHA92_07523 [Salvia divinorum]|uniref:Uncharacterized protein n=1 Tax=Salvia divinorum TaxID=28513 RepID=A0ABD1IC50_SALDI